MVPNRRINNTKYWGEIGSMLRKPNNAIFSNIQEGFACIVNRLGKRAQKHRRWAFDRIYYEYTNVRKEIKKRCNPLIKKIVPLKRWLSRQMRQLSKIRNIKNISTTMTKLDSLKVKLIAQRNKPLMKMISMERDIRRDYYNLLGIYKPLEATSGSKAVIRQVNLKNAAIRKKIQTVFGARIVYVGNAMSNVKLIARMAGVPKGIIMSKLLIREQPRFVTMEETIMRREKWIEGKVKIIGKLGRMYYSAEQK